MKIKYLFLILVGLALAPLAYLLIFFRPDSNLTAFYILEAIAAATIIYLIYFYRKAVKPFDTIASGSDLLRAQDWNTHLHPVGQPESDQLVALFNDLLDRLGAERVAAEEQAQMLDEFMATTPTAVVMTDSEGLVMLANPASRQYLSLELGQKLADAGGRLAPSLTAMPRTGSTTLRLSGDMTVRCQRRGFFHKGMPCDFFIIENVTETLWRAERAAYEKVIRVMAHEVNNVVGALTSMLDTIAYLQGPGPIAQNLTDCSASARALSRFVGRYAEVVKLPKPKVKPVELVGFIDARMKLLQSLALGSGVRVEFSAGPGAMMAEVDAELFEHVVINIVKNAVESILGSGRPAAEGLVEITLKRGAPRSSTYELTITDNGAGIAPDKAQKLFTPFFTDKPAGHGLGLMVIREVLRGHGFDFSLTTSEATGLTHFDIRIPAIEGD